ncbi:DUF3558 domain-containing protein [Streptomyces echinoruber]|uniref:DUF3558 domain-containing protein n=1 Tax=Streptomyces echinoruber TaxID=68898 RepID=A0A918RR28_9ACTN|nr:DUF3558 domain-containing protein [Streptomyces echinoruber]GHA09949.1 hypothetical protein GCM10010389_56450 [Streptomyces echinoruber]
MQRKAYVSGVAALLVALLAGCTGGSDGGTATDDANPGDTGTAVQAGQPGKYRTLPEPCGAVGHGTLDSLLPGIKQLADATQREKAYEGEPTLTYDTDRRVGCRWKVESADATDHLYVDFERVVSYDNAVSDDDQAREVFAKKEDAADLPEPSGSQTSPESASASASGDSDDSGDSDSGDSGDGADAGTGSSPSPSGSASPSGSKAPSESASSPSAGVTPSDLQPRTLDDLGDEAFVDDTLSSSGSTAKQRTVTVVFRTSNVIVTVEYVEQPATAGVVPDSAEMQDKARKLAARLADALNG